MMCRKAKKKLKSIFIVVNICVSVLILKFAINHFSISALFTLLFVCIVFIMSQISIIDDKLDELREVLENEM